MARTKKTATKNAAPVIVRSLDIPSLEKRVFNMDGAKIRNYDLFSLEKRIYDLEVNGGGGGGLPKFDVIQGPVTSTSDIDGTVTAKDYYPNYEPEKAFTTNSGWIAYSTDTYWEYTMSDLHKVNMISWDVSDTRRDQTPTGYQVSYDGETFENVTPGYMTNKIIIAFSENPIKAFRILFAGSYTTSTFPMMSKTTVRGE